MCVNIITIAKGLSKIASLFGASEFWLHWETRSHVLGRGGISGVCSRLSAKARGTEGQGVGFSLDRFIVEASFLLCRWLFFSVAAARETAGSLPRPCSGPSKPLSSSEPLGLEVGLFRRLSPHWEPAFKCLSWIRVILEAFPLKRCVTGGKPWSLCLWKSEGDATIRIIMISKFINRIGIFMLSPYA